MTKNFFPEKKISEISNDYLINSFKLNSIGHALIIKYFTPLFSEKRKIIFNMFISKSRKYF